MSESTTGIRQRGPKKKTLGAGSLGHESTVDDELAKYSRNISVGCIKEQPQTSYKIALVILTALAFATRFYKINHPNEVVFDEVHFGKVYLTLLRI